ncbi:hypothetical protein SAMN05421630_1084 [Prauserella marina]|uniref:Uncharacterized protein n=1 Tax=Prauserella marina TaxID=530584 RepID=A0A1G6UD10_9PSEU|nr:YbaB/EbfC family nucleoid-associated protein [Prauserella marina]PWV74849.1 hypothetical protein DES30_107247 [Prauserella marina]SDD39114.1 hypothetical protein SAMN05421630_1084 [Prauserella marina]
MVSPEGQLPRNIELPDLSALDSVMDDLNRSMERLPEIQAEMMSLTAEEWSDDELIRVVVGPRGQLVELELDPRVYREPDAAKLSESIMDTVTAAVRAVMARSQELVNGHFPDDIGKLSAQYGIEQPEPNPMAADLFKVDAEILADRKEHGRG